MEAADVGPLSALRRDPMVRHWLQRRRRSSWTAQPVRGSFEEAKALYAPVVPHRQARCRPCRPPDTVAATAQAGPPEFRGAKAGELQITCFAISIMQLLMAQQQIRQINHWQHHWQHLTDLNWKRAKCGALSCVASCAWPKAVPVNSHAVCAGGDPADAAGIHGSGAAWPAAKNCCSSGNGVAAVSPCECRHGSVVANGCCRSPALIYVNSPTDPGGNRLL